MTQKPSIVQEFLGYDIPEFGFIDPTLKPEFSWARTPEKEVVKEEGRRKK